MTNKFDVSNIFLKFFFLSAFLYIFIVLTSCSLNKNIPGRYATIFASGGFFGTTIILKKDSSLDYIFQGDMIYHHITGKYSLFDKKVFMSFNQELIDTNYGTKPFFSDSVFKKVYNKDTIRYQYFCYLGYRKLFLAHRLTGKKVNKMIGYSKRKKYLFFGTHYFKRKWYLKKIK